jgi:hypothetical protein
LNIFDYCRMTLFSKIYKAVYGLFLFWRHEQLFHISLLKGKRIAIVGPANSAFGTGRGQYIDGFDFVIRINKAPFQLRDGKFAHDIGTRTDILFHSFFENEFSGGGPLDFELYDSMGIQYVINPIPTFFGKRVTFNFFKKYLLPRSVCTLPTAPYRALVKSFGRFRPTTGFCALHVVLQAEFSELFITGFTFFKTPYGDNYRDSLKDVAVNKKYIQDSAIHNPDVEYEQFKVLLNEAREKTIVTDALLQAILAQDGVTLNEAKS